MNFESMNNNNVREEIYVPKSEIKEEVGMSENQEALRPGTRLEKIEKGDKDYLVKYKEALDKVEEETLHFLDGLRP